MREAFFCFSRSFFREEGVRRYAVGSSLVDQVELTLGYRTVCRGQGAGCGGIRGRSGA